MEFIYMLVVYGTLLTLTSAQQNLCPAFFGDFNDGNSCMTYLRCDHGVAFRFFCPPAFPFFDQQNQRCTNQQQINCVQNNLVAAGPQVPGRAGAAAIGQVQQPAINQVQIAGVPAGVGLNGGGGLVGEPNVGVLPPANAIGRAGQVVAPFPGVFGIGEVPVVGGGAGANAAANAGANAGGANANAGAGANNNAAAAVIQPPFGNPWPIVGNPLPPAGNPWPIVGNPLPPVGNPWPIVGNPLPPVGNPWAVVGNPLPPAGNPVLLNPPVARAFPGAVAVAPGQPIGNQGNVNGGGFVIFPGNQGEDQGQAGAQAAAGGNGGAAAAAVAAGGNNANPGPNQGQAQGQGQGQGAAGLVPLIVANQRQSASINQGQSVGVKPAGKR